MADIDPTIGRRTATDKRKHFRMTAGFFTQPGKLSHVVDPVERMATLALLGATIDYCREHGTNGHFSPEAILEITGLPPEYGKTLITDGVWHQTDHGCPRCPQPRLDGAYLHDYLMHNRSAEQEQLTSERRSANGAKGGNSRWAGYTRPEAEPAPEKRRPGRPRKHPLPQAGEHPAQKRARAATDRAATAAERKAKDEAKVYDDVVLQLCEELAGMVKLNGFSVGKLGPAWWKPCEQLLRIGPPNADEGVTPEQIRKAIRWANEDAFWWQNIRSMQQLREKYEQLRAAAKDSTRAKRGAAAVRPARRGAGAPPAAVTVPGMSALYGRQQITTGGSR
jgi:hypothetical protein